MKKTRKVLALLAAAAVSASLITAPVITADAAAMTYDTVYDMDTLDIAAFATNKGSDDSNSYLTSDPADSSNKVWATRNGNEADPKVEGNGLIVADMDFPTQKYLQIEFDLKKETISSFHVMLYNAKNWSSGTVGIEALNMTTTGNVDCKTINGSKYEANKWYSFKIVLDIDNSEYMLWMKERGETEYRYLAEYKASNQTFDRTVGYRLRLGSGGTYTYLDNVKISGVDSYNKSVHYEFNNVQAKTNQLYFNMGNNCNEITWSQAEFDGEQVLEGKLNSSAAKQPYTADRVPDMDKAVIEAHLGFDSRDEDGTLNPEANLPYEFGIIPVFEDASGNKNVSGYSERTAGIKFGSTRYINVEGKSYDKALGTDTVNGYNLADGKLYTAGYVYDRINKIYKAYFITNHGETLIRDVSSNAFVQDQRNLAGVQLWLRADNGYYTGKGYYDYLRIDEPEAFVKQSVQTVGDKNDMSLMPQINIDYNYVIDPECLATAAACFTPEGESQDTSSIPASLSTYNGKTLVVTSSQPLNPSTRYVMTICADGIKDLLGQGAAAVETTFTTGTEIKAAEVTLEGGTLKDGVNTANLTLTSNDGKAHDAVLVAGIYDKTTDELLAAYPQLETILATGSTEFSLKFDTTDCSNYKVKIFAWSGSDTMIPYIDVTEFTK